MKDQAEKLRQKMLGNDVGTGDPLPSLVEKVESVKVTLQRTLPCCWLNQVKK